MVRLEGLDKHYKKLVAILFVTILLLLLANPVVSKICVDKKNNSSENKTEDSLLNGGPGAIFEPPYTRNSTWKNDYNYLVKTLKLAAKHETGLVSAYAETLIAGDATGGAELCQLIYIGKKKEITVSAEILCSHNVGKFGFLPSGVSTSKTMSIGSKYWDVELDKFWTWDMFFDVFLTVVKILFPYAEIVTIVDLITWLNKIEDIIDLTNVLETLREEGQGELIYMNRTKTVSPGLVPIYVGVSARAAAAASYAAAVAIGQVTKISIYGMDPPDDPIISGDYKWKKDIENNITITCSDKNNDSIYFRVDWGDYEVEFTDEITSGSSIKVSHKYEEYGDYTIKVVAFDNDYSNNYNPHMKSDIIEHEIEVEGNWPPHIFQGPQGPTEVEVGEQATYTTYAYDHNDDPIYFQFDWDYGDITDWLGPYESEEVVSASHTWNEIGSPFVCVRAIDDPNHDGDVSDGIATDWECISVEVPRTNGKNCLLKLLGKNKYFPFIYKLIITNI